MAPVQKPRTIEDDQPPTNIALPHDGLTYRFPFDTEKKTYPYFDPIAQKAFDANYDGEEDVNGLTTYRFTQNVGYDADGKLVEPVKYASLYDDDEDGQVTAPAGMWGLPGDPDEPITMTRYYAAQRTFWVDPVSGTIVKSKEHANHYYAREALKPEVTFVDYTVTSNEQTVESQVAAARDERDRVALWGADPADHLHRRRPGRADRRRAAGFVQPARRVHADRPRPGRGRSRLLRHPGRYKVPAAEAKTEKTAHAAAQTATGPTG